MTTTLYIPEQVDFNIYLLILLGNANLITIPAKDPMERRQGRKFQFLALGGNPRELIHGNPRHQAGTEYPIHIVDLEKKKTAPRGGRRGKIPPRQTVLL